MDDAQKETLNHFFRMHGMQTEVCHEPGKACGEKPIKAHSIPCSSVLKKMAKDGHIIFPKMKINVGASMEVNFDPVGVNNATTFSGLCSTHDNSLFKEIDVLPDPENAKHLFLLAYRAVIREFHVVLQNAVRFQSTLHKRVEVGISSAHFPDEFGMHATQAIVNLIETEAYKNLFDRAFLESNWAVLVHHVKVIQTPTPTVAVNSMFSLEQIDRHDTPRVCLNVYPTGESTIAVFSATKKDMSRATTFLSRMLQSDQFLFRYLLSKLILQNCDNFVVAPDYWFSLTAEQRSAIESYFFETVVNYELKREDKHLYLF